MTNLEAKRQIALSRGIDRSPNNGVYRFNEGEIKRAILEGIPVLPVIFEGKEELIPAGDEGETDRNYLEEMARRRYFRGQGDLSALEDFPKSLLADDPQRPKRLKKQVNVIHMALPILTKKTIVSEGAFVVGGEVRQGELLELIGS